METSTGPWIVGALLGLAAFVGLMVRWIMARLDALHAANQEAAQNERKAALAREERLQAREDQRTELMGEQTATMRSISQAMASLHEELKSTPKKTADEIRPLLQQRRGPAA